MKKARILILLVTFSVFLITVTEAQRAPAMAPRSAFEQFENRIVSLDSYSMTFSVATEGSVNSKLEGTMRVSGNAVNITAGGNYGSESVEIRLRTDRQIMTGGTLRSTFEAETPEDFYRSFVFAMTRLGLAYNLLRLAAGEPPDFPAEDEKENDGWITISYISAGERQFIGNIEAFPFAIRYGLRGEALGEGRVWINVNSGLPFRREATLLTERGRVNVVEHYGYSR